MDIEEFRKNVIPVLEVLQQNGSGEKSINAVLKEFLEQKNSFENSSNDSMEEQYKSLTLESISSYKNSNTAFANIADKQAQEIQQLQKQEHINIDTLQEKFASIQEHMINEVKRANNEIARLTEKVKLLEEESNVDPLTKVFNRRALEKYLQSVCQKKKLFHELHILILDLDDFKKINDKYGHLAGDKILIFVAQILRKMLRDGDKIFRYGGEEFVIVLNRITTKDCETISKRILHQISNNNLIYKGDVIKVTVSIGSTKYQEGDTPESLLHRADEALYEAKNSGKNKIVIR